MTSRLNRTHANKSKTEECEQAQLNHPNKLTAIQKSGRAKAFLH